MITNRIKAFVCVLLVLVIIFTLQPVSAWTDTQAEMLEQGIFSLDTTAVIKLDLNKLTGEASYKITAQKAKDLIEHAKNTAIEDDVTIEINGQLEEGTKKACIQIEDLLFKELSSETDASLRIDIGFAAIELSSLAIDNIYNANKGRDISFQVAQAAPQSLPEVIKEIVEHRPVYDMTIMAGNTRITDYGGETLRISIPYSINPDENPNTVVVYSIDEKGKEIQTTGVYNMDTGKVEIVTNHMFRYAIGYQYVHFNDIWNSSAKSDIEFVAARGLMMGIGNGEFGADRAMTRGMLVTVLGKLAGAEPVGAADFYDVAPDKYYSPYIAWAAGNGIVKGTGNNMFRPDRAVSREELKTILSNFLKYFNINKEITVEQLLSACKTDSKDVITRAEFAVILRKIIGDEFRVIIGKS